MKEINLVFALALCAFLAASCSGPREEVTVIKPSIKPEPAAPPAPPRVFTFEDRYFVRDAAIDNPANVDDPLQAIRVIQLKPGANQVIVISSFDKANEQGKEVALETWLGIEMPSFAPGVYDISKAVNIKFYRFYLGQSGKRLDGTRYKGDVIIEENKDGILIGSLKIEIAGETKSFEEPSREFRTNISGSFRVPEVPFDATIIKSKRP
jgi:hypothetical protein